jgi:hypothetical protein
MYDEGGIMMNNIRNRIKNRFNYIINDESGSIIVIVTISIVVLLSILAMVIDLGIAYLSTSEIQKAADASVYSAGRLLPIEINDSQGINEIKTSAIHYASLNDSPNLTSDDIILGDISNGQYTSIKVSIAKSVPMTFARVFGVDAIPIERDAAAKISPISRTTGLAPIGVTKEEMDWRIATNNLTHVTLKYGVNSDTTSFFGALDLDGQGGGAKDYGIWIAQGYEGEISIGDILLEENGNMVGPTYDGFIARFNGCTHFGLDGCTIDDYDPNCSRIIKVPIYSLYDKKNVKVDGFAAFLLESQTNDGYITGSFLNLITSGITTGENMGEGSDFGVYNLMLTE